MADKESKTEKPTPKRLKEARSEGRIAKSPDLISWGSIFVGVTVIRSTVVRSAHTLTKILHNMSDLIANPDAGRSLHFMTTSIRDGFMAIVPLILTFMVLAVVANLAQVRFVLALKAIKPSFGKLNPINGIKRLVSTQSIWQAGKELIKVFILGFVAWKVLYHVIVSLAQGGPYSINYIISVTAGNVLTFIRYIALAGMLIGLADYSFQRRKINNGMKMSKHEIKQESRQADLAPEIKGKIRRKQREMSRNRMMAAVREADVVIVNPVHIAIALKYDPKRGAPRVTAKGAGFVAEKIRDLAAEHSVPLVQDIPLARTLHRTCDVDDEIPLGMFEAVAKVLAFVFSLKNRGTGSDIHRMPGTPSLEEADRLEEANELLAPTG